MYRKVSKVGARSDFKLDIKLIQGYTLIKARGGNSYGFSTSLLEWQRNAINVLLLTQAASFQKISHQWPFTLCLALPHSRSTWSESKATSGLFDGVFLLYAAKFTVIMCLDFSAIFFFNGVPFLNKKAFLFCLDHSSEWVKIPTDRNSKRCPDLASLHLAKQGEWRIIISPDTKNVTFISVEWNS